MTRDHLRAPEPQAQGALWVFTGPTLSADEVRAFVPSAHVRPPIAAGDLWSLPIEASDTVAIIDGYFLQQRSIRHKELIDLIQRGVRVAGAASMGALRAAELHAVGMVGVGTIFGWYRDGVIDADDEVTVVHGDESAGFRQVTRALVDVRASLDRAVGAGLMTQPTARDVIDLIGSMPFANRDDATITALLRRRTDDQTAAGYLSAVRECWVDRKGLDARELLRGIATETLPSARRAVPAHEAAGDVTRVSLYPDWRPRERVEQACSGESVVGWQVIAASRILARDMPQAQERIALAALRADAVNEGVVCAEDIGTDADIVEVLLRVLGARGLLDVTLTEAGSPVAGHAASESAFIQLTDPFLLPDERAHVDLGERARLFIRRMHIAPWRLPDAHNELQRMQRWSHWREIAGRINHFNAAIRAKRPTFNHHAIPTDQMKAWCAVRWLGDDQPSAQQWQVALADRGYASEAQWRSDARWLFPFAKLRAVRYDDLDVL